MTRVDEHRCRAAYDQVADLYADHIQGTEPEQDIDLAMINHFMSLVPQPRRVLDAGCERWGSYAVSGVTILSSFAAAGRRQI